MLKALLLLASGSLVGTGALYGAAPMVDGQGFMTSRLVSELEERLGRSVEFEDVEIGLGRVLRVRLVEPRIGNAQWAAAPYLARAEVAELAVKTAPLLRGRLHITEVTLQAARVNLERAADGRVNWRLGDADSDDSGGLDLAAIDALQVGDAKLVYRDPARRTDLEFALDASTDGDGGRIAFEARGDGRLLGEDAVIRASGDAPLAAEPGGTRLPVDVRVESAGVLATVSGTLAPDADGDAGERTPTAELDVALEGASLARLNPLLGTAFTGSSGFTLSGQLHVASGEDGLRTWRVQGLALAALDSDLSGELTLREKAAGAALSADLQSTRLDAERVAAGLAPASAAEVDGADAGGDWRDLGLPASVLRRLAAPGLEAELRLRAGTVVTGDRTLRDAHVRLALDDGVLAVRDAGARIADATVSGTARIDTRASPLSGDARVAADGLPVRVLLDMAEPDVATSVNDAPAAAAVRDGVVAGEVGIAYTAAAPAGEDEGTGATVVLRSVEIRALRLRLQAPGAAAAPAGGGTDIVVRVDPGPLDEARRLEADGTLAGTPFDLDAQLPPVDAVIDAMRNRDRAFPVTAVLRAADARVDVSGELVPALPLPRVDLELAVRSADPAATAAQFGYSLPAVGALSFDARLQNSAAGWSMTAIDGALGDSDVHGDLRLETRHETPRFEADLRSARLDLASFVPSASAEAGEAGDTAEDGSADDGAESALQAPAWLSGVEGTLDWQVETLRVADVRVDGIDVEARLADGRLHLSTAPVAHAGGRIDASAVLDVTAPGLSGRLQASARGFEVVRLLPSAARQADDGSELAGTLDATIALRLAAASDGSAGGLLDRVRLDELRASYDDPDRRARTDLRLVADSMTTPARVDGVVEIDGTPVRVDLVTGTLRDAIRDFRSLPVDARFRFAETTLAIDSRVDRIFPLESFSGAVRIEGPSPAQLGEALSLPLPDLPPYRVRAQLERTQQGPLDRWDLDALEGRIGDSDVAGTLRVAAGDGRPFVFARLRSRRLDFDDLAGTVGAAPDPDETVSARQAAEAERLQESPRLFPSRPIRFENLRAVDADVRLRAARVVSPRLPLDDLAIRLRLEDGLLEVSQLDFGAAGGTVALTIEADARTDPLQGKLTGDVNRLHLQRILAGEEAADDTTGIVGGRVVLWMTGDSLARWLASADGGMFLTMTGGTLDTLLVELAGLDLAESAVAFLGNESDVTIECAYADLQARAGTVVVEPLLFDTADTRFEGSGTIDLREERLDLVVKPYPKDFSLLSMRGPLEVKGTLRAPEFEVNPSFPTPELGLAEDSARCAGLIESLREARKTG